MPAARPAAATSTWSPRSAASSSGLAQSMPAAASTALPSARARRRSRAATSSGRPSVPNTACTALARLVSSLPYLSRMTSGRTGLRNWLAARSAATWPAVSSAPAGYRPTGSSPVIGVPSAVTAPGSRCTAGSQTLTP